MYVSYSFEGYLVRTVFLVDHPSQHPTAELTEMGEREWDWDKIPSPAVVFQRKGGIPPSL